jgi:hypothetical protein
MKKLVLVALALVVVLAIVVPAAAQTTSAPATRFTASGSAQAVIPTAGALRMHVNAGSPAVKSFIGGALTLRVGSQARILKVRNGVARLITLSAIHAGDQVSVSGRVDRSEPGSPVFIAQSIRDIVNTPPGQLTHFTCGGPVKAVDWQGAPATLTLTVNSASDALRSKLGTGLSLVVTPATQLLLKSGSSTTAITLSQVTAGEQAWVTGTIDRSGATPLFTATKITVRPIPSPTPSAWPGG